MFEILCKNLRKLIRGRHDKAVVVVRPRYEVLYASVFEHAVELVNEGSLNHFRALRSTDRACRSISLVPVSVGLLVVSLGTALVGRTPCSKEEEESSFGRLLGWTWGRSHQAGVRPCFEASKVNPQDDQMDSEDSV